MKLTHQKCVIAKKYLEGCAAFQVER